jgi:hypothetical protein
LEYLGVHTTGEMVDLSAYLLGIELLIQQLDTISPKIARVQASIQELICSRSRFLLLNRLTLLMLLLAVSIEFGTLFSVTTLFPMDRLTLFTTIENFFASSAL